MMPDTSTPAARARLALPFAVLAVGLGGIAIGISYPFHSLGLLSAGTFLSLLGVAASLVVLPVIRGQR